jgi:hypothetical protein
MTYTIYYGHSHEDKVDITTVAIEKCLDDNVLTIPENDFVRAGLFGDPYLQIEKSIYVEDSDGNITDYTQYQVVVINPFN